MGKEAPSPLVDLDRQSPRFCPTGDHTGLELRVRSLWPGRWFLAHTYCPSLYTQPTAPNAHANSPCQTIPNHCYPSLSYSLPFSSLVTHA